MPQDRKTGAAWDTTARDRVKSCGSNGSRLAWEFLRRNEGYREDYARDGPGSISIVPHESGTCVYAREITSPLAAKWGLELPMDPALDSAAAKLFWAPSLLTHVAHCHVNPVTASGTNCLSLASFGAECGVLKRDEFEFLAVNTLHHCAHLIVEQGSVLADRFTLSFWHNGFDSLSRHTETLRILAQVVRQGQPETTPMPEPLNKFHVYLLALDGHLAGKTYRDIAEVIYGAERVDAHWTDDTRWMKSKVRRAVERGVALMSGGYRSLL